MKFLPRNGAGLAALLLTLFCARNTVAQHVANPFVGATQYVNPDYATEVKAAIAMEPSGSTLAQQMATVATYPTAVWIDHMGAIAGGSSNSGRLGLAQHISTALAQKVGNEPIVMTLVIYDLPQRDCAALASNGEISIAANPPSQPLTGIQTYEQNYITPIYNILQSYAGNVNLRFVLIIEPDSLPNLITNTGLSYSIPNCLAANGGQGGGASLNSVYVQGIQYAITQFHNLQNVYQYIDVGQSGWLGWTTNLTPAVSFYTQVLKGTPNGFATIDGFISNTANYVPTKEPYINASQQFNGNPVYSATFYQWNPAVDEATYDATLYQSFVNAGWPASIGFLIDTSRNGWGGSGRPASASSSSDLNTYVNASKTDRRDDRGNWCNQQNAGIGVPPVASPSGYFANLQAFVWIKPPGESDGTYATSTLYTGGNADENCDPAHNNALANGFPTNALANPPSAGTFWPAQFSMLVQNSYPVVPLSGSGGGATSPAVSASSSAVTVSQGAGGTATIFVTAFSGSVTLSASGLPNGVSASFATNPTSGSSALTLSASNSAATGTASITITGTSGNQTASTNISLTVNAAFAAPSIASLSASSGAVGSPVTITGANFGASQGSSSVSFGGTAATVTAWSNTAITVTVPNLSAGAVNVSVIVSGVASNVQIFTVSTASCTSTGGTGGTGTVGAGYWHTSGNKILDVNGNVVRMAGVNWYGFETPDYIVHGLWAQDYKTILNDIKTLGYNVVRIPFSNQMVESNPVPSNFTSYANGQPANTDLVGKTALQDLDLIISYAGSIGLRVILDNHRSEAGESNEANGLWYTSAYPQGNWVQDWQTLAARYSGSPFTFNGNPTLIGMDLRNEPHLSGSGATSGSCWTGDSVVNGCPTTLTTQNWPVAAQVAGNAVLAVNPKLLIFVEGNDCYDGVCGWEGGNLMGVAKYPVTLSVPNQLVYSAHDYGPNLYQQPWFTSGTTPASLSTVWNQYWGYISANGIAPVWLGEFGTDQTSSDIQNTAPGSQGQWFQNMVSYLAGNPNISWTYWALNGEDSYGLLDNSYDAAPASALKQQLLSSIQSPLGGPGTGTTSNFSLSAGSSSITVQQGGRVTNTITVSNVSCPNGAGVTLSASGLPSGVTASFGTNPTTGASLVSLTAANSAAAGTVTVTITGISGSLNASTTFSLTVNATPVQSFTLAANPASVTVTQGSNTSTTISITAAGGFNGSVTLAASGLPSGVTASFGTNPTTGSSLLTLTAGSTAAIGFSTVTITGKSGNLTASTGLSLTVKAATVPSFTLAANPASVTVTQGGSTTTTVSITAAGGFSGGVTLAASSLPSGVTPTFATNPATGSSVLTLTASGSTSTGTSAIVITGTSGNLSASTNVTLTVNSGTCTPTAIIPYLQVNGAPWQQATTTTAASGATVNLGPQPFNGGWSWSGPNGFSSSAREIDAIPLSAGTNTFVATFTNSNGCKSTQTFVITVTSAAGSFTLAPSPTSVTVAQGRSATSTLSVTPAGGFSGTVTLAASGLPSGVTASFGTNPTSGSSLVTFAASSSAATGTTSVTITGTSGNLKASTSISLTVNTAPVPGFTVAPSPSNITVTQGKSATSTISVMDLGGFAGNVTLAAYSLPSGVTATFGTNPTNGSSLLTFTASSAATTGTTSVTVTGTSGNLTASTSVSLTVVAQATGGFACHVAYTVTGQWPGGFGAAITIYNTGNTAISNWTLAWTYANGQTITELWNGTFAQAGSSVTVNNMSYNGTIPAGGNYNGMGFNGTWTSTNAAPTTFAVNGTTCN